MAYDETLAVRIRAALVRKRSVKEFDITGRPMNGWVLIEPEVVEGDDQFTAWIERGVKFVGKLPKK